MNKLSKLAVRRIEDLTNESGNVLHKICREKGLTAELCTRDTDVSDLMAKIREIGNLAEALRESN